MKFKMPKDLDPRTIDTMGTAYTPAICKRMHADYPEAEFASCGGGIHNVRAYMSGGWEPITKDMFEIKSVAEFSERVASRYDLHFDEAMGYWKHRDNVIMAMSSALRQKLIDRRNELFEEQEARRQAQPTTDKGLVQNTKAGTSTVKEFIDSPDFRPEIP